jgi:DNA-binding CsgD family transcriptional regulator
MTQLVGQLVADLSSRPKVPLAGACDDMFGTGWKGHSSRTSDNGRVAGQRAGTSDRQAADSGAAGHRSARVAAIERLADDFSLKAVRVVLALGVADALLDFFAGAINWSTGGYALGLLCLGAWGLALAGYKRVTRVLQHRPWLLVAAAAASAVPIALDGGANSALLDVPMPLVWLAAIVASARLTIATGVTVALAFLGASLAAGLTPSELVSGSHSYGVITNALDAPLLAVAGILLAGTFRALLARGDAWLEHVRRGALASTPAIGKLILGQDPLLLLPGTSSTLTDSERAVVDMLAEGLAPKEIAALRGTKESTVRFQIKQAKKKTGTRTINQLVAIVWGKS